MNATQTCWGILFALSLGLFGISPLLLAVPPPGAQGGAATAKCDLPKINETLFEIAPKLDENPIRCVYREELQNVINKARQCPSAKLQLATALHAQAICSSIDIDMEEALPLFHESADLLSKIPEASRQHAFVLGNLATHFLVLSRLREADYTARKAIEILDEHKIQDRKTRWKAMITRAAVATHRGQYTDARKIYETLLQEPETRTPTGNLRPFVLAAMLNYAELALTHDLEETDAVLQIVLQNSISTDKQLRGFYAWSLAIQSQLEDRRKEYDSARSTGMEALVLASEVFNPLDPVLAQMRSVIGGIFFRHEKYDEAEKLMTKAIATWNVLGIEDGVVASTLDSYAELLRETDRKDQAERLEARVRKINNSVEGKRRRQTVDVSVLRGN